MVDEAIGAGEVRDDFDRDFVIRILKFIMMYFVDIYPDYREFLINDIEALKEESRKIPAFLRKGLQKGHDKEGL